jgi:hypothetical protein
VNSIGALCAVFVTTSVLAQSSFTCEFLRLPSQVRVTAVGYRGNDPQPAEAWEVVESLDWVWARQDWFEGGSGAVPLALTVADGESSLRYDIRTRRGVRDNRLGMTGTTRVDGRVTPLAWLRLARYGEAHGDRLSERALPGGEIVVTLESPHPTGRSFECTIDPVARTITEVRRGKPPSLMTIRYSEWSDIGGGHHFPMMIEHSSPAAENSPPLGQLYMVETAASRPSGAPMPDAGLPSTAVIDDQRAGQVVDGVGRSLTVPPPAAEIAPKGVTASAGGWTAERWALVAGLGLLAAGLGVWAMKRRAG